MNKPFRFRYTNELVGVFVLLIVMTLAVGIFVAGRAQHWFETFHEIRVVFPPEGTFGLQRGAEVHILGTPAGVLERIWVDEDGSMHAILKVRTDFARFIRTDSEAVVKRVFGIAGDAFVEIEVGRGSPLPMDPVPTLPIRRDTELVEMLTDLVQRVEDAVLPAIDEIAATLQEYRALASDLRTEEGELRQSLAHVQEILRGLEAGEGTAGRWLRDPSLAEQVEQILVQVQALGEEVTEAVGQARGILGDVQTATGRLPLAAETVEAELRDVPGTVLQARATLREAEVLMAGVSRHWFLRRYVDRETPLEMIPVHGLGHGEGD